MKTAEFILKQLRQEMTPAAKHLWTSLRARRMGVKFRRQHPMGHFVVDFVCLPQQLVIEVDGSQHFENPADRRRDDWLAERGYRVLRFWNDDVLNATEGVLAVIAEAVGLDSQSL